MKFRPWTVFEALKQVGAALPDRAFARDFGIDPELVDRVSKMADWGAGSELRYVPLLKEAMAVLPQAWVKDGLPAGLDYALEAALAYAEDRPWAHLLGRSELCNAISTQGRGREDAFAFVTATNPRTGWPSYGVHPKLFATAAEREAAMEVFLEGLTDPSALPDKNGTFVAAIDITHEPKGQGRGRCEIASDARWVAAVFPPPFMSSNRTGEIVRDDKMLSAINPTIENFQQTAQMYDRVQRVFAVRDWQVELCGSAVARKSFKTIGSGREALIWLNPLSEEGFTLHGEFECAGEQPLAAHRLRIPADADIPTVESLVGKFIDEAQERINKVSFVRLAREQESAGPEV